MRKSSKVGGGGHKVATRMPTETARLIQPDQSNSLQTRDLRAIPRCHSAPNPPTNAPIWQGRNAIKNPIWDRHFDPIWDRSNLGQALWTSEHNHTRSRRELFQSVGRPRSPRHAQHRRSNLGQAPFVNRGHESRTSTDCGGVVFRRFRGFQCVLSPAAG